MKINRLIAISKEYINVGGYDSALEKSNTSLLLSQKLNYSRGIIYSYGNIGTVYWSQGDYPKALDFYYKELKQCETTSDRVGIGKTYHHIGNVFADQGEGKKALDYYFKAMQIYEEVGNTNGKSTIQGNIGLIYLSEEDYVNALKFSMDALKMFETQNDKHGIARQLYNIGIIYRLKLDYDTALNYYFRSMTLAKELDYKKLRANILISISGTYILQGNSKAALQYVDSAIAIHTKLHIITGLKDAYGVRAKADSALGNYLAAFEDYKICKQWSDSVSNEEARNQIAHREMSYEFEKKETIRAAEQVKKDVLNDAKERKQKIITWSVIFGLLFTLIFTGIILRSLRITRKQKEIIEMQKSEVEKQKDLVEENQKQIIGSITYAKRLQDAILPPADYFKKHFPKSFIFYKPKAIVAGDFYWMEETENLFFIAVADCTGHGVPGALVSVVCSNALNRTIKEFKLTETGKILDKVRELVLETFSSYSRSSLNAELHAHDVYDGMDISLLTIQKKTGEVKWSGANNPLWFVASENGKAKFSEALPDKQPIGRSENKKPFTTHSITFSKGTNFYLFTDGLADQFGGPKGKKFMYKAFKELLLSFSNESMDRQLEMLSKRFDEWKGDLEQVDDITVIGIQLG